MSMLQDVSDESIDLEAAGVLTVEKVKPKEDKKKTRVTQVCGSMTGQDVLFMVKEIEAKKAEVKQRKDEKQAKKGNEKIAFLRCQESCVCSTPRCSATGLKRCTSCGDVLKSQCSKAKCKGDNGEKPLMDGLNSSSKKKSSFLEPDESDEDFEMSEISVEDDDDDEDLDLQKAGVYEAGESSKAPEELIKKSINAVKEGDWVKVKYEEEIFIGKVIAIPDAQLGRGKKRKSHVRVRCLKSPYGIIRNGQDLEEEDVAADYTEVFECNEEPKLVKTGRAKWQWKY